MLVCSIHTQCGRFYTLYSRPVEHKSGMIEVVSYVNEFISKINRLLGVLKSSNIQICYENLDASFMASASWPFQAIQRSTSSLFSFSNFRAFSSAIFS